MYFYGPVDIQIRMKKSLFTSRALQEQLEKAIYFNINTSEAKAYLHLV